MLDPCKIFACWLSKSIIKFATSTGFNIFLMVVHLLGFEFLFYQDFVSALGVHCTEN